MEKNPDIQPEMKKENLPSDYLDRYQKAVAALHAENENSGKIYTPSDILDAYASGAESEEQIKEYIKNGEIELNRQAADITLGRVQKYEDLNADNEEDGEKKFLEITRKLWKEFAVHGRVEIDPKTGEKKIAKYTDLDGKCSLYLMRLAGIKTSDLEYLEPGKSASGRINLDTGKKSGFSVEEEGKTAFLDHHTGKDDRETSATRVVYATLVKTGLLEKEESLDKLVEFVTQMDNNNYPESKKYFRDSWQMMLGLSNFVQPEKLAQFFRESKTPTDILSPEELKKYGLIYKIKGQEINRSAEIKEKIEKSWAGLSEMEKEGWIFDSDRYGKIAVDAKNRVPSGATAAEAYGCDTYIIYDQEKQSFFISTTREITDEFSQGEKIRQSMWIKPVSDKTPLSVSLEEILAKMTDGKFKMPQSWQEKIAKNEQEKKEKPSGLTEGAREIKDFLDKETKRVEQALANETDPGKRQKLENEKAILELRQRRFDQLLEREKQGYGSKKEKDQAKKSLESLGKEIDDETIKRYLDWKKENEKGIEAEIKNEVSPEALAKDLDAIRKIYLEAKRISGNWRRKGEIKVKIKGKEEIFRNKEIKTALPLIGEEYNRLRSEYIRGKVSQEIAEYKGENVKAEIVNKLCDAYLQEERKNEALIEKRDKTLGTRFKEWYRRHPYARMAVGYGLGIGAFASLATGQFYLTPWLIGARAGLAGISATMGTEAAITKYSKKLGERGIAGKKTLEEINKLSPEQAAARIHTEIAHLTALQERKGKKLEQAGPRETIITALREMEREIMRKKVEEVMQEGDHSKEALLALALNGKLDAEAREKDKLIETFGDQEREKSIKRWKYSAIAGVAVAGLSAGLGLYRWQKATKLAGKVPGIKTAIGKILGKAENTDFKTIVRPGDSVWKIAKRGLAEKYGAGFTNLDEARQTYIIDAVKDRVAANPSSFGLQDVDILKPGQSLDLGKIFGNQEGMENFFKNAKNLSRAQIQNILKNNETLANFHKTHPGISLDSEKVDQILNAKKGISAPDTAIAQENILKNKPTATIPETEIAKPTTPATETPDTAPTPDETLPEEPAAKTEIPETSNPGPEINANLPVSLQEKMQTMLEKINAGWDIDLDIAKLDKDDLGPFLKALKANPEIVKIHADHIKNLSAFSPEDNENLQKAMKALADKITNNTATPSDKLSQKLLEKMAMIGLGQE